MNEKQLLGYLLLVLRNAGYKRAIDALIEDAAEHGFTVTKLEDDGIPDGYFSVDYTLDGDGVIRGRRMTDAESREAIYDRLGIVRSGSDILSRDELRKIVEECEHGRETDT